MNLHDVAVLAYSPERAVRALPLEFVIAHHEHVTPLGSVSRPVDAELVVTFGAWLAVRTPVVAELARSTPIVDIEDVACQLEVLPRRGDRGDPSSAFWIMVDKARGQSKRLSPEVQELREKVAYDERDIESLTNLAELLTEAWHYLLQLAKDKQEMQRLCEVEVPTQRIMLDSHLHGIAVDRGALDTLTRDAIAKKTASSTRLRNEFGIVDPGDSVEVAQSLENVGMEFEASFIRENANWDRTLVGKNELLLHAKQYAKSSRAERILLSVLPVNGRIHPRYRTFGTVTGRTTVTDPALQNLPRGYRSILRPSEGYRFVYPDYRAFEPSILADETGDSQLISDVNSGQLYEMIAVALFDDVAFRDVGKRLFVSFCNGMSTSGMVALASSIVDSRISDASVRLRVEHLLSRYPEMIDWSNSLNAEGIECQRLGSRLGNYRTVQTNDWSPEYPFVRWGVSQRIQGTASLILKRAMLRVSLDCPSCRVVLPMHDAALIEVPIGNHAREQEIVEAFTRELANECPSIEPQVVLKDFFEQP